MNFLMKIAKKKFRNFFFGPRLFDHVARELGDEQGRDIAYFEDII